jgi:Spy/CpxP family protein refolding chaperone
MFLELLSLRHMQSYQGCGAARCDRDGDRIGSTFKRVDVRLLLLRCCPLRASSGGALFRPGVKEVAMRTLTVVVALVVGMAVYATRPADAVQKTGEKVAAGLAERIQDLHLTDQQETKIADIRKDCKPKVEEAARDLAAIVKQEVEKVRAVLTPDQMRTLETAKEERKELRGERLAERIAHLQQLDLTDGEMAKIAEIRRECHPKTVKAMQGLEGILTQEQKTARVKALQAGMKRSEFIASLKLTNEQKEKVDAVGNEVRNVVRDELAKMQDVLTEGQKEQLQEFKTERREQVRDRLAYRIAHLKELNLTDAQRNQIAEIRQEFRPRVQEAGNKLRATIREEVEAIVSVIKR